MQKFLLSLALSLCIVQPVLAQESNKKNTSQQEATRDMPILDASLIVPSLAELNIKPNYPVELLSVDSKSYQNELTFTAAAEKTRYFFDKDSNVKEEAVQGGYYRDILGTTVDGKTVAQDFYQDSQTPQTAPFILTSGKEKDFSTDSNDGRVIWYSPEGKVTNIAVFEQGKRQSGSLFFTDKGLAEIDFEADKMVFYSTDGKLLSYTDLSTGQDIFYYYSGKIMTIFQEKNGKSYYRAWNEAGQEVEMIKIAPDFMGAYELQQEIFQSVMQQLEQELGKE